MAMEGKAQVVLAKATKSDDAEVPVYLWNQRVLEGLDWIRDTLRHTHELEKTLRKFEVAMRTMRKFLLRIWVNKVGRDFQQWFDKRAFLSQEEKAQVYQDGCRAVEYAKRCTWWDWTRGSAVFFWRWETSYQEDMRVGNRVF